MSRYQYHVGLISVAVLMSIAPLARALPDDCLNLTAPATFLELNGLLCLQKIGVMDQAGTLQLFKASLQWLGLDHPNRFQLLSTEFDTTYEINSRLFQQ